MSKIIDTARSFYTGVFNGVTSPKAGLQHVFTAASAGFIAFGVIAPSITANATLGQRIVSGVIGLGLMGWSVADYYRLGTKPRLQQPSP